MQFNSSFFIRNRYVRIKGVRTCKGKLALMPSMPPDFLFHDRRPTPFLFYPRAIATFTTPPPSVDWTKLPPPVAPPSSLDPLPYIICSKFRIWRCNGVSHPGRAWNMSRGGEGRKELPALISLFPEQGLSSWSRATIKKSHWPFRHKSCIAQKSTCSPARAKVFS